MAPTRSRPRSLDHLRAIAVFARTAELGSFRGAASALGLSPSVVSHHVSELEAALGVALLYRTTRSVTLTEAGAALLASARVMIAAAEEGVSAVGDLADSPKGTLRVAAPAAILTDALYEDLAAFARAHPRVAVSLHLSDTQVDVVDEGMDLAIRAGALRDSALLARRLFDFERKLVSSPAYAAERAAPSHPRDLASWDWIGLRSRPPVAEFFSRATDARVELPFRARVTADAAAALVGLARGGAGVAMVPSAMAAHDLEAQRLVEILPAYRLASPPVYAIFPSNAPRSGLAQRFVRFVDRRRRPGAAR
ncbi:MAG: LysR family transcriptional regulator [Polyangiaceae bacterium]